MASGKGRTPFKVLRSIVQVEELFDGVDVGSRWRTRGRITLADDNEIESTVDFLWPDPPSATRLGQILLALLGLSGATGIALALGYDWTPGEAHAVVASQIGGVLGWVWGVHAWAASILLVLAVLHPMRAWIQGRASKVSWRKWLTGVGGLGALVFAFFSGTILPWDQQGWEALQHVQYGFDVVGLTLFDVDAPSKAPLEWVFHAHAFVVPVSLAALVGAHLWRTPTAREQINLVGNLAKAGARRAWPLALAAAGLAVLWPPLHGPAPIPRLQLTRPDWLFLWMIPIQQWLGSLGLWVLPAGLAGLAVAPLLSDELSRRCRLLLVAVALTTWLGLTLVGLSG
jgi:ubiquinol-cytochrome c reductase cytochrome b subunit